MKKLIYIIFITVLPILGYAQEGVLALPKAKRLDTHKMKDLGVYPILSKPINETTISKPNLTGIENPIKKIESDPMFVKLPPIKAYIGPSTSHQIDFKYPYTNDYAHHAFWGINDKSFIVTSSTRESMPAIGRSQYISASYNVAATDWLSLSVGTFAGKMQFNDIRTNQMRANSQQYGLRSKSHYNDFGVNANARFKVNDRLAFDVFGSYSKQAKLNLLGVPALGSFATRSYGGTMDVMITETVGVKVGAERYFDANSGKWRVSPIISPIFHFK